MTVLKGALDVHRTLLAAGVSHEVVQLETRIAAADELPRALGLTTGCAAVRCYRVTRDAGDSEGDIALEGDGGVDRAGRVDDTGGSFAAVLVPAGREPLTSPLLAALSARAVQPAPPAEVNARTRFAAGLVSPVDLPPAVELVVDAALCASDVVYTAVGEGGLALGIRTRDLLAVTRPRVAALTGPAPPGGPHQAAGRGPTGADDDLVIDLDGPPAGGAGRPPVDPPRALRRTRRVPPGT